MGPMRTRSLLVLTLLLLAGCAGAKSSTEPPAASSPIPTASPAAFDEETGGLEGQVLDDEQQPLPRAQVDIAELGLETETDAVGAFSFSRLPPGTYRVRVGSLGFEAGQRKVDIVAGEVERVTLILFPIPSQEAYPRQLQQRGLLGCAVHAKPGTGFSACGAAAIVSLLTQQDTSNLDKFVLVWKFAEPSAPWNTTILDMKWTSTQALGNGLTVIWEVNICSGDSDLTFGSRTGRTPIHLRVERDRIAAIVAESSKRNACLAQGIATFDTSGECNDTRCNMQTRVFSAAETTGQSVDVGATVQQPFEQWITNFYNGPAPDGYSAIQDQ